MCVASVVAAYLFQFAISFEKAMLYNGCTMLGLLQLVYDYFNCIFCSSQMTKYTQLDRTLTAVCNVHKPMDMCLPFNADITLFVCFFFINYNAENQIRSELRSVDGGGRHIGET